MLEATRTLWRQDRETAGFAASLVFVALSSVRDVYFARLFQREQSPMVVAAVAFTLCTAVYLPIVLRRDRVSVARLVRRPRDLFWVNATAAMAWLSFFRALSLVEPALVQILFAGVGPLAVAGVAGWRGEGETLAAAERRGLVGLSGAVALAGTVAILEARDTWATALGVSLAVGSGLAITANTVLCRRLNDAGVAPMALVAMRFPGTAIAAAAIATLTGTSGTAMVGTGALAPIVLGSLVLVVLPVYVNQVGVALASPFTVRVALAGAPALIFALQLAEGRLPSSPWVIATASLYGVCAMAVALARRQAIRSHGDGEGGR